MNKSIKTNNCFAAVVLRSAPQTNSHVHSLYTATIWRLRQTDIDQEVKERAIVCTSQLIANLGHLLTKQGKHFYHIKW